MTCCADDTTFLGYVCRSDYAPHIKEGSWVEAVSYTHLDVYKRQYRMHVMWISGRAHSVMEACRDIRAVLMQQLPQTEQMLSLIHILKSAGAFAGRLIGIFFLIYVLMAGGYLLALLRRLVPVKLIKMCIRDSMKGLCLRSSG